MRTNNKSSTISNLLLIVAAGLGKRLGEKTPKALVKIYNKPLLYYVLTKIYKNNNIEYIFITYPEGFKNQFKNIIKKFPEKNIFLIKGGAERNISVYNALTYIYTNFNTSSKTKILIHDAARVLTPNSIFNKCLSTIKSKSAVIPFLKVFDTLRGINNNIVNRNNFILTQTPQGFLFKEILQAYRTAVKDGFFATDDAGYFQKYIGTIKCIEGDILNFKVTYKQDLNLLRKLL